MGKFGIKMSTVPPISVLFVFLLPFKDNKNNDYKETLQRFLYNIVLWIIH